MEFLIHYGLFLAQTVTIVVAIIAVIILIFGLRQKSQNPKGEIRVTSLSEGYKETELMMQEVLMNPSEQKNWLKEQKQEEKKKRKNEKKLAKEQKKVEKSREGAEEGSGQPNSDVSALEPSAMTNQDNCSNENNDKVSSGTISQAATKDKRFFVIDFDGSMDAHEVTSLRQEISAILTVATSNDSVIIRLTSPGGVVHGYGLAASQLTRLKNANISLIACVDKVAASGGYMMACVADKIIAAPFAILGSIGVVAQVPNFNRLLKKNDIDVELHTAGAYKRTLTLFGENTDEGREKFKEELNATHELFKQFVMEKRPSLSIDTVATGEHWYGTQALQLGLIDEVATSDEYLESLYGQYKVLKVEYKVKKSMAQKVTQNASKAVSSTIMQLWQNNQKPML